MVLADELGPAAGAACPSSGAASRKTNPHRLSTNPCTHGAARHENVVMPGGSGSAPPKPLRRAVHAFIGSHSTPQTTFLNSPGVVGGLGSLRYVARTAPEPAPLENGYEDGLVEDPSGSFLALQPDLGRPTKAPPSSRIPRAAVY